MRDDRDVRMAACVESRREVSIIELSRGGTSSCPDSEEGWVCCGACCAEIGAKQGVDFNRSSQARFSSFNLS